MGAKRRKSKLVTKRDAEQYPLCYRHGLLRRSLSNNGHSNVVVSTAALYELLKPKQYQACCRLFEYHSNSGPRPDEIEMYLQKRYRPGKRVA